MIDFIPKVADISHYNSVEADGFHQAKAAGLVGIIAKSSQGTRFRDKDYNDYVVNAREAGLMTGAYHFNTGENVAQQVDWFLECANPDEKTCLALDYENNPRSDMSIRQAVEFLHRIEDRMGRKAVLYSGNKIKETINRLNDEDFNYVCSHRLWLAQYGYSYRLPPGFDKFWIWQYTGDGRGPEPHYVPGITIPGNKGIDLNVFEGTDEELIASWAS